MIKKVQIQISQRWAAAAPLRLWKIGIKKSWVIRLHEELKLEWEALVNSGILILHLEKI